jgi:hypothetical protein
MFDVGLGELLLVCVVAVGAVGAVVAWRFLLRH